MLFKSQKPKVNVVLLLNPMPIRMISKLIIALLMKGMVNFQVWLKKSSLTLTLTSIFAGIDVIEAGSPLPPSSTSLRSSLSPLTTVHPSPSTNAGRSQSVLSGVGSGDDTLTEEDDDCLTDDEEDYSDQKKKAIMVFLNGSSQEELCDIPGCSKTKAKLLVKHLPFDKWEDLVKRRSVSVSHTPRLCFCDLLQVEALTSTKQLGERVHVLCL